MRQLVQGYFKTFQGLSKEIWWLSLITLINRTGTVVVLFLSLYLTQKLGFTKAQVGVVMSFYGLGSIMGSWLGGVLTDRLGYYRVMVGSLFVSGVLFILLQFVEAYYAFCFSIFLLLVVADTFRPAMYVALSAYSQEQNRVRSMSLIRLAINLGFSVGPALAGLLIGLFGYVGLFWMDGITCISASICMLLVLYPKVSVKKLEKESESVAKEVYSVYKDKVFWVFLIAMLLFAIVFLQFFSTLPLFFKEVHHLSELEIGLFLGGGGLLMVICEMPFVKWLETVKWTSVELMILGVSLVGLSVLVLNFSVWIGILFISMLLFTVGEMVFFPFSNTFATKRSERGRQGAYMAMYTMSFSVAHVISHNFGMQMVHNFGFTTTWYVVFAIGVCSVSTLFVLRAMMNRR